jgi:hypothetical protein
MDDILTIRIHQMQDFIKQIITDHDLDIVSLGNYITEALREAKCNYTFKLIKLDDK